jgi:hypothetical protein
MRSRTLPFLVTTVSLVFSINTSDAQIVLKLRNLINGGATATAEEK